MGVNDRADLMEVEALAQRRHPRAAHAEAGVTFLAPDSICVEAGVDHRRRHDHRVRASRCAAHTRIGAGCAIGPAHHDHRLRRSATASRRRTPTWSRRAVERRRHDRARSPTCAPARTSARARRSARSSRSRTPRSARARRCRTSPTSATPTSARTPTSAPATSPRTTTARTSTAPTIGDGVETGVDTSFVAPVDVGDGAYTGAGSVITEDVPDGRARDRPRRAEEHRGIRGTRKEERG